MLEMGRRGASIFFLLSGLFIRAVTRVPFSLLPHAREGVAQRRKRAARSAEDVRCQIQGGVSRCCASSFSLLVQRERTKRKDTPALRRCCASVPCGARDEERGRTRCAQTCGRFSPSSLRSSAQRKGAQRQQNRKRQTRSPVLRSEAGADLPFISGLPSANR